LLLYVSKQNDSELFDRFVRRGFSECSIDNIPEKKKKTINLSRNSKYYMKKLLPNKSGITVGGNKFA
jgi:amino-acid N-acetyltransferase